jgi:hypothetical protein
MVRVLNCIFLAAAKIIGLELGSFYTFQKFSILMTELERKPVYYADAKDKYLQIRQKAESFLIDNFLDPVAINQSEKRMIKALKAEYRRLQVLRFVKTNIEQETLKLIRFFFIRERREDVRFRNYSTYLRDFMKKNRQKMIKPWNPIPEMTFDEVIAEMVSRLTPAWEGPYPVLNDWIPKKLKEATEIIPVEILKNGGVGKIFRVISGVYLYVLTDLDSRTELVEAKRRTDLALKSGYYFGLLHPLVDDLLDSSHHLLSHEKKEVLRLLDHWIGGDFNIPNPLEGNKSVAALKKALQELYSLYTPKEQEQLIRLSYFLHFAQMEDMQKEPGGEFTFTDTYVPVLLKAACTRLISCWFSGTSLSSELTSDILETGLVFQLMDDFRDFLPDVKERSFTPFTNYFLKEQVKIQNPWLVYMRAIDIFIIKSPNRKVSRQAILRRVAISIRYLLHDEDPASCLPYLNKTFKDLPESLKQVKRILNLKGGIIDPDRALFEPVDWYFKS